MTFTGMDISRKQDRERKLQRQEAVTMTVKDSRKRLGLSSTSWNDVTGAQECGGHVTGVTADKTDGQAAAKANKKNRD